MKFRKTLSLLLVLAMIMSTAPLHAWAATEPVNDAAVQEEALTESSGDTADAVDSPAVESGGEGSDAASSADDKKEIVESGTEDPISLPPAEEGLDPDESSVETTPAVRTIMMYICGSNLETYSAMATYNIRQILDSKFSSGDKVRFIVMTGGSDEWQTPSELLVDPENPDQPVNIDPEYNQVWEAKGKDAAENPGKMVLLERKGLHEKKARVKTDEGYDEDYRGEMMSYPQLLKDFINYCAENYPAEKYDLILWDHGSGPLGGFGNDEGRFFTEMKFDEMLDAFSDNDVTKDGGKFDFINFDACLMGSVELALAFADCTDYYIASAENIPGYGEPYTGWLNKLGEDPDYDTYKLGKFIVDDYIRFYEEDSDDRTSGEGTLGVIDMKKLISSGFVEGLLELPSCLIQQATEADAELHGIPFYDEFDAGKNSISYGGENYFDLGTFGSQLSFDFKEIGPSNLHEDGSVNDNNVYTKALADLNRILAREGIIYARGTKGIKSKPLYYRDAYGKINYDKVGTSGLYLYFPTADNAKDVGRYFDALEPVVKMLAKNPRREFLNSYRHAVIDYGLISKAGYSVTQMLDNGSDRSSINYDSFREYFTGGAEFDPSNENIEAEENSDYTISDWNLEIMPYLLRRADMDPDVSYARHKDAEEASKKWLDAVIRQQAEENISRKDMTLVEAGDSGYLIRMENTKKRVVEDVRYNITASIPAAEEFFNEHGEDFIMMPDEEKDFITARIGHVSGTPVYKKEDGTSVDQDSKRDLLEWYMEPGGTWELPEIDDSWYTVMDANGYCHVANIERDEDAGETYFYGNYKSENGIDTLCCLSFNDKGELNEILLGTEDGNSYRRIPASEMTGEVEVMPIRQVTIFVDEVSIPLSQKPIIVSPKTVKDIKLVKKDLNEIEDLKKDGGDVAAEHTIVVRDIYGYEVPLTKEDAKVTITYDLNGGEYEGSTADIVETYAKGEVISIHEAPAREGYEFMYWKGSEYMPGDKYTVTEGHTFTAQWKESGTSDDGGSDADSDDPGSGSKDKKKPVNTGDQNDLTLCLILMSISAAAFLAMLAGRRRKKERE